MVSRGEETKQAWKCEGGTFFFFGGGGVVSSCKFRKNKAKEKPLHKRSAINWFQVAARNVRTIKEKCSPGTAEHFSSWGG